MRWHLHLVSHCDILRALVFVVRVVVLLDAYAFVVVLALMQIYIEGVDVCITPPTIPKQLVVISLSNFSARMYKIRTHSFITRYYALKSCSKRRVKSCSSSRVRRISLDCFRTHF